MFELDFKKNIYCLPVADLKNFSFPQEAKDADLVNLKITENDFIKIQISFKKDAAVSFDEQVRWFINSCSDKPIENYYYDYQIYSNDESNEVRGLAALAERDIVDTAVSDFLKLNKNINCLLSDDDQFVFFKNKINFFNQLSFLKKINKYFSYAFVLFSFFTAINLSFYYPLQINLEKSIVAKNTVLDQLENEYNIQRSHTKLIKIVKCNQKENQKYLKMMAYLTKQVPEKLYFNQVKFSLHDGLLTINGFLNTSLRELNGFLKKSKKNSAIADVNLASIQKTSTGTEISLQLSLRGKRRFSVAKETVKNKGGKDV